MTDKDRADAYKVLLMRAEILISSYDMEALRLWWKDVEEVLYG